MKKAQGLPLNTIVLAVIAIIVLVVVILFATGNLSKLFGSTQTIASGAAPDEIAAFKIACKQACFQAQQLAESSDEWKTTQYCTRTVAGTSDHCYDDAPAGSKIGTFDEAIIIDCKKKDAQGVALTCA